MNTRTYRFNVVIASIPFSVLYILVYNYEEPLILVFIVLVITFILSAELLLYLVRILSILNLTFIKPEKINLIQYRIKLLLQSFYKIELDSDLISYISRANKLTYRDEEELNSLIQYYEKGIPFKYYSSLKSADEVETILFMIKTYNDNGPSWERRKKLVDYAQKHNFTLIEATYPEADSNSSPTFSKETEAIINKYI